MNRRQVLVGTSAATFGMAAASGNAAPREPAAVSFKADAREFGVAGDGVTDDAPAIQAALDYIGRRGGGTVLLPPPKVHYRLSRGLKLPSYVALEGPAPVQYPYNAGNVGACVLVADFVDPRQWIIESATRLKGRQVPFDGLVADELPDGVTYNCAVRNLLITSKGKVPFGGIRMHGCPGASVEDVSIDRVGCGLLVNYSFGGHYRLLVNSLYYGVAVWDEANANTFQVYCAHSTPWPKMVPPEYRLPFMAQMQGYFVSTLLLSSEDHASRPYGILCGSIRSTSIGNVFDAVIEGFAGGVFLYNAYATDFRQCYIEAAADVMACAIAASRSRFSIQALHAYLSGTGAIFDFGIEVLGKIFASGILDAAGFGKAPLDNGASLLLLEGVERGMPGAPFQRGVRYAAREAAWTILELQGGWGAMEASVPAVRIDPWSHRVEFRGSMEGGRRGACFILPQSCRPPQLQRHMVAGGEIEITPDGIGRVTPNAASVSLDGVGYARW